jgi:hypothetical protein
MAGWDRGSGGGEVAAQGRGQHSVDIVLFTTLTGSGGGPRGACGTIHTHKNIALIVSSMIVR